MEKENTEICYACNGEGSYYDRAMADPKTPAGKKDPQAFCDCEACDATGYVILKGQDDETPQ